MNKLLQLIVLLFLVGCNSEQKVSKEIEVNHDLDQLSKVINLENFSPTKVDWVYKKLGEENSRIPGPTDYQLESILYFEKEELTKLKLAIVNDLIDSNDCSINLKWLKYQEAVSSQLCAHYNSNVFSKGVLLNGSLVIKGNNVYLRMYTN